MTHPAISGAQRRIYPAIVGGLLLAIPSAAQQIDVVCTGSVSNVQGTSFGAFSGAAVGDSVSLSLRVSQSGSPSTLGAGTAYAVDPAGSSLMIGTVSETAIAPAGTFELDDDTGMMQDTVLAASEFPSGSVFCVVLDPSGALLSTEDLASLSGTSLSIGGQSLAACAFGDPMGGDLIEITISSIDFGQGGGGAVGSVYCAPTVTNSTGAAAALSARGSNVLAQDDVTLECSDLPAGTFVLFLTSRTQGTVANPGGSRGTLCLGGQIGRYIGPGQIQSSGQAGFASLGLDLSAMPTPVGLVGAQAGETWNFQAWYRDSSPSGVTSDFSNGYEIAFQ